MERQRSYLSVLREATTLATSDAALEASWLETLRECALVGTVERFDVFWRRLCLLLETDAPVASENVADNRQDAVEIDAEARAIIERHTAIDRRLHAIVTAGD